MKVTIISLDNWGYNEFIAKELKRRGIDVRHINFNTFKYAYPNLFYKIANFFSKNVIDYNFKREHLKKKLFKELSSIEKQDCILVIKGDNLNLKTLELIKSKTDRMVAFFNDSMSRCSRMKKTHPYFDEVFSFEPEDVKKHNFKFITNYIYFDYHKKYSESSKYEVFNISSLDKRTKTMPQFAKYFNQKNISFKLIAFAKKKQEILCDLGIEQTNKTYNLDEVFKMVEHSKILLDLQRPKQEGLSFRIFEAIALNKKIISTNKSLKNYDFYNPANIAIVDSDNIQISNSFFNTPYEKVDACIIEKYHISSWVSTVFNL